MGEHFLAGDSVGGLPMTGPDELRGRAAEAALLTDCLRSSAIRQVVLVGPAGVGKTALACRALRDERVVHLGRVGALPTGYPQLLHGLTRLVPDETAAQLAGRLRFGQETPTAMVGAVLDALPPGRVAVLLDGAEDIVTGAGTMTDTALEEALRALLSAPAHRVTVVITTRGAPGPLLAHRPELQRRIDLGGLPSAVAVELLRSLDEDGELGLRDGPVLTLTRAAKLTGGNPRALEAIAAAGAPLAELLELLEPPEQVPAVLAEAAFFGLDPLVREVAEVLAVFPVPVPAAAVDGVLRAFHPEADSAAALAALESRHLVRTTTAGRYSLHPADRDHLLDALPEGTPADADRAPPPYTLGALRQLAATLLAAPAGAAASIDDLVPQLAEFELRCANGDFDGAARALVRGPWDALRSWGHLRLALALLDRLSERVIEPRLNGWCISALASCYAGLNQPNRAIELHERARVISVRTMDAVGEATEIGNLGRCEAELGDIRRAIRLHERALGIFRDIDDRDGAAAQLLDLAWCHAELGHPDDVVALLDGSSDPEALALSGAAHRENGRLGEAIARHEEGVELCRADGDRRGEAVHAGLLGVCHTRAGRVREAAELHRRALEIDRSLGHRIGESVDLARLGVCHVLQDELSAALDVSEQALAIARETADLRTRTDCLGTIAWCFLHLDDPEQARWFNEQAIGMAEATGSVAAQATAHLGLARTHLWAGHPDAADKALRAASRHRHPPAELEAALIAGAVELRRGEDLQASTHFARTVTLAHAWLRRSRQHVDYAALDICALARAGLTVTHSATSTAAIADFRSARGLTSAPGVVAEALHWLDALTPPDRPHAFDELRPAAAGREPGATG